MTSREIKQMITEIDKLDAYMGSMQKHYFIVSKDKFYRTGELPQGQIEILSNILRRLRADAADKHHAVASDPKPVSERVIKPDTEEAEINELFNSLFSFQDLMTQSQYILLIRCYRQWKLPQREIGAGPLTFIQKRDLYEMLKWLKSNYPNR